MATERGGGGGIFCLGKFLFLRVGGGGGMNMEVGLGVGIRRFVIEV